MSKFVSFTISVVFFILLSSCYCNSDSTSSAERFIEDEAVTVQASTYTDCESHGNHYLATVSSTSGFFVDLKVGDRAFARMENFESGYRLYEQDLKSELEDISVKFSENMEHGVYIRKYIDRKSKRDTTSVVLFHMLPGGPAFISQNIKSPLRKGQQLNWKSLPSSTAIAEKIIRSFTNDPNGNEQFYDSDFQRALYESHRNSAIDMALFAMWKEWSLIDSWLIKERLKEMSYIDLPEKELLYGKLQLRIDKPLEGEATSLEVFDIAFSIKDNPKLRRAALKKILQQINAETIKQFGEWNDKAFEQNQGYLDLIKRSFPCVELQSFLAEHPAVIEYLCKD
jgi:hypothetical protein